MIMTEIDLHKFYKDNNLEYHWHDDDVILFVDHWSLDAFMVLLGHRYLTDGEIKVLLKDGYICVWMKDICEDFDIDIKKIF